MNTSWQADPGSANYYALRFCEQEQQQKLRGLLMLKDKLLTMIYNSPDPGASRLKLDWWRNQLTENETRDPLILFLKPFLATPASQQAYLDLLSATDQQLDGKRPESSAYYFKQFDIWGHAFAKLMADVANITNADDILKPLGSYIARIDHLNYLHLVIQKQKMVVPQDLLEMTTLTDLFSDNCKKPENLSQLTEHLLQEHRHNITFILNNKKQYTSIKPILRLVALVRLQDNKLQKSAAHLLKQSTTVSPLINLWTAWRL